MAIGVGMGRHRQSRSDTARIEALASGHHSCRPENPDVAWRLHRGKDPTPRPGAAETLALEGPVSSKFRPPRGSPRHRGMRSPGRR
jgi:hypothetical protein